MVSSQLRSQDPVIERPMAYSSPMTIQQKEGTPQTSLMTFTTLKEKHLLTFWYSVTQINMSHSTKENT